MTASTNRPNRLARALELPLAGVICDLDGVVYRGDEPIPDAVAALRAWHDAGVRIAFVTNNSSRSAGAFARKLQAMGVPTDVEHVFDSGSATARYMQRRWPAGGEVFAIGEPRFTRNLRPAASGREARVPGWSSSAPTTG